MSITGRTRWAVLHLLDRQILDRDGQPVAKVDDLRISEPTSVSGDELPIVTDLICGPAALGRRLGRRTGALLGALRNLHCDARPEPNTISFDLVTDVSVTVRLGVGRDALDVTEVDEFLAEHVIGHIPGSNAPGESEQGGSS
jgi:hypothetical protein